MVTLPFGMWCLSADRIALVMVWFAVCGLVGVAADWRMDSISSV